MFFNRRIPLSIRESYYYDSATAIIWGLFWGTSVAFFPVIARKMGASNLQMAFLSMAPFIGSLFTLYWSRLSSNTNEMHFFILIKFLARIVLFLMFLAINPYIFIVIVFLNSFFERAGSPAYVGIIKQIYPENYRGRSMGYVRVERAVSAIFASIFSGFNVGGGELSRINYITKITSHREVQTYWGIDFTLMGIRGIIAPLVGISLMKFLGIKIAFISSFGVILLGFIFMTMFNLYYNPGKKSVF